VQFQFPFEEENKLLPLMADEEFVAPLGHIEIDEKRFEVAVLLAVGEGVIGVGGGVVTATGAALAGGGTPVSVGGELFLLMKGELRVALRGSLELGLFVDAGNLWLDPRNYRLLDLRPSAGLGLRFVTPVGPAALDLGFNLQPDRRLNERTFAPHFTIGLF